MRFGLGLIPWEFPLRINRERRGEGGFVWSAESRDIGREISSLCTRRRSGKCQVAAQDRGIRGPQALTHQLQERRKSHFHPFLFKVTTARGRGPHMHKTSYQASKIWSPNSPIPQKEDPLGKPSLSFLSTCCLEKLELLAPLKATSTKMVC